MENGRERSGKEEDYDCGCGKVRDLELCVLDSQAGRLSNIEHWNRIRRR